MSNQILFCIYVCAIVIYLGWFRLIENCWPWEDHDIKPTNGEGE